MKKNVLVVGAGASGLTASIFAARAGASVTVLEAMERPGKKLLLTGNGRCNLTNLDPALLAAYYGVGREFAGPALTAFPAQKTLDFFRELGLLTVERKGCVYPYTNQASSVLEVLLAEVRRLGIRLKQSERVTAIRKIGGAWRAETETWRYDADSLILACGSRCAPQTGSDGSGYLLAEMAGLSIAKVSPGLAPLRCREPFLGSLAGLRCAARVSLLDEKNGEILASEIGEVQWTGYGISGIAVFQLSRIVSQASETRTFCVLLDLLYPYQDETLTSMLEERSGLLAEEKLPVLLRGILPEKLVPVILKMAGLSLKQRCRELSQAQLSRLLLCCRRFRLEVIGTKSFDSCQVCAGGVDVSQICPQTMECKSLPGLYVTGELLDVDGPCGGYNLQWAWASGYTAGCAAAAAPGNAHPQG